jgi:hypothetical protein
MLQTRHQQQFVFCDEETESRQKLLLLQSYRGVCMNRFSAVLAKLTAPLRYILLFGWLPLPCSPPPPIKFLSNSQQWREELEAEEADFSPKTRAGMQLGEPFSSYKGSFLHRDLSAEATFCLLLSMNMQDDTKESSTSSTQRYATLTLLWRYIDATLTLLWRYIDATLTLHWRYSDATLTLHWRYSAATFNTSLRY